MAKIDAQLVLDTKQAKKGIDSLKGAFRGLVAAASIQQFVSLGDEFTQITNRLKSVSDSSEEASSAFNLVKKVAGETRSGLGPVADLFTDLTIATEEMGLSQQRVADVAGTFSKALKISGADANASSGAIRQFGQALASGVLRGDEFNSIMEANPAFMREIAKALDVNVGQLRKMAAEGQLTSDVLVKATEEIGGAIDEDFGKTVATVGESITNLRNNFIEFIGKIQEKTGVFTLMSNAINAVADNLNIVVAILAAAFGAAIVGQIITVTKGIIALGKSFQGAAKGAAIMQAIIGGPAGVAKVLGGLVAGGGALYLMDQMFEDTAESTDKINKELDDAAKNAKDLQGSGKKALEQSKEQVQAEKDAKTARDEAARILENQLEDYKAISAELEVGRAEFEAQLGLQNDLLTASNVQKQVIQDIADLESQRADELRDLAALTKIDADDRLTKEKEINEEYDERIDLIKKQSQAQMTNATNTLIVSMFEDQLDAAKAFSDQLQLLRKIQSGATDESIRNYQEENTALREYEKQRREIMKNIFGDDKDFMNPVTRQRLYNQLSDVDKAGYDKQLDAAEEYYTSFIMLLKQFQIERQTLEDAGRETTFGQGFAEQFDEFEKNLKDMASYGANIFNTMTTGWENAFLKFAETGKLSFKDLFKTLMTEIIKMMANKLFLALFMPGSGVFGSLFAGFFNQGGTIPAGKIGIAGENGPEIVKGPGTVISTRDTANMLGGGVTNVYYRIEATDPASFQAQVARDPEFIYNVTRAGARRIPG